MTKWMQTSARLLTIVALTAGGATVARTQATVDVELKKLADEFTQAWAKGDAKAIAAIYAEDAIRQPGAGPVLSGRAAIEQNYALALSGPFKGSRIVITPGLTKQLTADVVIGEGQFQISGGSAPAGTPMSGSYANTYIRQGGRWVLAMSAISYPPPAR